MRKKTKGTAGKEAAESHSQRQFDPETCFFGTNATGGLECADGHQNGVAKGGICELVFFWKDRSSEFASWLILIFEFPLGKSLIGSYRSLYWQRSGCSASKGGNGIGPPRIEPTSNDSTGWSQSIGNKLAVPRT
jgi:hypothetical protein